MRLPHALRGLVSGEAALPRSLVLWLIDEFRSSAQTKAVRPQRGESAVDLTPRQSQVLELLKRGRRTADIGGELFLSPVTVRRHISSMVRKLRVPDRQAILDLFGEERERG